MGGTQTLEVRAARGSEILKFRGLEMLFPAFYKSYMDL